MSGLGLLNFVVLQWFGVRLARVTQLRERADDLVGPMILKLGWITQEHYDRVALHPVTVGYCWIRWVWPLTGWWSSYWYIKRPGFRVIRFKRPT